jgi:predicted dehydrogenase
MASSRSRYMAAGLKARELVSSGRLGTVYYSRSTQLRQRGRPGVDILQDATWFISKARAGGGALIDIGVYEIDQMLWLMGNPRVLSVSATAFQGVGEPRQDATQDVEDHASVFLQLEGGKAFMLEIAWSSHVGGENTRFLLGDRAGLRFSPLTLFTPPAPGERNCVSQPLLENDSEGGGLPGVVRGFIQGLQGGPEPMTPARDALVVTQVIDAAYRSAASGAPVTL